MEETFVAATQKKPEEIDLSSSMSAAKKSIDDETLALAQALQDLSFSSPAKTNPAQDPSIKKPQVQVEDVNLTNIEEIEIEEDVEDVQVPAKPIAKQRRRSPTTAPAQDASPEIAAAAASRRRGRPATAAAKKPVSPKPAAAAAAEVPSEDPVASAE